MFEPILMPRMAGRAPWGTLASIGLHAVLLALLAVPVAHTISMPPERSIAVDILSTAQFTALLASTTVPVAPPPQPQVPATPEPPKPAQPAVEADGMVHATTMHAAAILDAPDNQQLRRQMEGVADSERLVQICGIEGIEQLRDADPSLHPDMIVAYAMGEMEQTGLTIKADGAAFRSDRKWYALRFTCTAEAGLGAVADYAFAIGEPIPRDEWEAHDLTEDETQGEAE